jgi:hypothetical protein
VQVEHAVNGQFNRLIHATGKIVGGDLLSLVNLGRGGEETLTTEARGHRGKRL